MPRRRLLAAAAAAATSLTTVCAGGLLIIPGAQADPLASAQARAKALNHQVQALQAQEEIADQKYDAIEERLGEAVNSSLSADREATAARAAVRRDNQRIEARVQELYASAGSLSTFGALLSGTASQAVERTQLTATVLQVDTGAVGRERAIAVDNGASASRKRLTALQVTKLQKAATAERDKTTTLLDRQRSALAAADATVRHIAAQQRRAAAEASAAEFDSSMLAQGVHLTKFTTPPNATVAAAIDAARSRLGVPYVWGATGPDSFDCSGLTQWSYARAGIALPRTAAEQWYAGPHPSLNALEPGDLLFYSYSPTDPATIHHVTLYIGGGMMIAAPETGQNVQIQPVYMDGLFGATRPWASS